MHSFNATFTTLLLFPALSHSASKRIYLNAAEIKEVISFNSCKMLFPLNYDGKKWFTVITEILKYNETQH